MIKTKIARKNAYIRFSEAKSSKTFDEKLFFGEILFRKFRSSFYKNF